MSIIRHGYAKRRNVDSYARAQARRVVIANTVFCALCGGGYDPDDPYEADHIVPVADGGSDELSNLRGVHRSCNRRRG
jgi:5-methylcytosine-specific restriction endonuclease McrA